MIFMAIRSPYHIPKDIYIPDLSLRSQPAGGYIYSYPGQFRAVQSSLDSSALWVGSGPQGAMPTSPKSSISTPPLYSGTCKYIYSSSSTDTPYLFSTFRQLYAAWVRTRYQILLMYFWNISIPGTRRKQPAIESETQQINHGIYAWC